MGGGEIVRVSPMEPVYPSIAWCQISVEVHVIMLHISILQFGVCLWVLSFFTNCITILTALFLGKSLIIIFHQYFPYYIHVRVCTFSGLPIDVALLFTVPVLYEMFQVGFKLAIVCMQVQVFSLGLMYMHMHTNACIYMDFLLWLMVLYSVHKLCLPDNSNVS